MEQGSDEWKAARLGKVTASRVADVMAKTKTGPSASRANYMADLAAERLTGTWQDGYTNSAMAWGNEKEDEARAAYEFKFGVMVEQVGFVDHYSIPMTGASPDGTVGDDGLIEIKCPNTATHIETLLSGKVPAKYEKQIQWQMECTQRQWCDFVSYDPRMPEHMRLFVKRVFVENNAVAEIRTEVESFLAELDAKVAALTEKYKEAA